MQRSTLRRTAVVVALALFVGAFTGAFLLPTTSHSGAAALLAAAQRTLDASSYRVITVSRGAERHAATEEFIAPDRMRLRGASSIPGAPATTSLFIGTSFYGQSYCGAGDRQTISWSRQTMPKPVQASSAAATAEYLIDHATEVRFVAHTPNGDRYSFTPGRSRPDHGFTWVFRDGNATVADGRLREVSYSAHITYEQQTHSGAISGTAQLTPSASN